MAIPASSSSGAVAPPALSARTLFPRAKQSRRAQGGRERRVTPPVGPIPAKSVPLSVTRDRRAEMTASGRSSSGNSAGQPSASDSAAAHSDRHCPQRCRSHRRYTRRMTRLPVSPPRMIMLRRPPARMATVDRRDRMAECARWRVARHSFPDQHAPEAGDPPTPPWHTTPDHAGPGEFSACRLRSRWSAPSRHGNSTETAGKGPTQPLKPAQGRTGDAVFVARPGDPQSDLSPDCAADPANGRDRLPGTRQQQQNQGDKTRIARSSRRPAAGRPRWHTRP